MEKFKEMIDIAKEYFNQPVDYVFTGWEKEIVDKFFTNADRKVFFVRFLPPAISTTLLSMYSRIKNSRGIRGHFVDNLLPLMLASFLPEFARKDIPAKEIQKFLKEKNVKTLNDFVSMSREAFDAFHEFSSSLDVNGEYVARIASSPKIKQFLSLFLDQYGHNSIARMGTELLCIEGVSTLAAKSIEWCRPGSGFIELSTRFVDMQKAELYPIWNELMCYHPPLAQAVKNHCFDSFTLYKNLMNDGSFAEFLRNTHKENLVDIPEEKISAAIFGETCDVMGNFLPAATLTSLGVSISGEAMPELIKHLRLDATPENHALADTIIAEAEKTGANQFLKRLDITPWNERFWAYLYPDNFFAGDFKNDISVEFFGPSEKEFDSMLQKIFSYYFDCWNGCFSSLCKERGAFDKLPPHFEILSGFVSGVMSFRGWRDLHRMGFCMHLRTVLTSTIGFYQYDKPAPEWFSEKCRQAHMHDKKIETLMNLNGVLSQITQYPLALGNLVGFAMGFNFREIEFCNWQRTKFSVNHEVRKVFLEIEKKLRGKYDIWNRISRADMTPAYIFARLEKNGSGIPLEITTR